MLSNNFLGRVMLTVMTGAWLLLLQSTPHAQLPGQPLLRMRLKLYTAPADATALQRCLLRPTHNRARALQMPSC